MIRVSSHKPMAFLSSLRNTSDKYYLSCLVFHEDDRETLVYKKKKINLVLFFFNFSGISYFSLNFLFHNLQPRLFVGRGMQEGPISLLK